MAGNVFTIKCILPEIKMQGWEFSAKNHNVGEGRHGVKVSNEIQIHQKIQTKTNKYSVANDHVCTEFPAMCEKEDRRKKYKYRCNTNTIKYKYRLIILTAICEKVDRSSNAGSNGFACSSDLGLKGCNLRSCWKKRQNQKTIQIICEQQQRKMVQKSLS